VTTEVAVVQVTKVVLEALAILEELVVLVEQALQVAQVVSRFKQTPLQLSH
jgi:hypothetical protein